METNTTAASYFNIFITGHLESANFPLGPEAKDIFCRYEAFAGPDWELVSGTKNGITQLASNRNGNFNDPIVFNMPIELTYRSTNVFGWPQLIVCVYGRTRWGIETSLGYSRLHVPVFGSGTNQRIVAPILKPRCSNAMADVTSWITGRNPELKDSKILLDNTKTKGLSIESYGEIEFVLNVITRGSARLGLEY
ncbi:B9 domain-containing protein 1 [Stomoxys calcitrans]|uniref:B9 domain-containing protein 1 n=1 Tax=Stomoxys calcitrans TaxID=35570 RepID=UPI0027E2E79A|nr:B9 domain-containing protein 1 [Stomoxys calcitrans]